MSELILMQRHHAGPADSHYRGQANTSSVLVGVDSLPAPDFTLNVKFKQGLSGCRQGASGPSDVEV